MAKGAAAEVVAVVATAHTVQQATLPIAQTAVATTAVAMAAAAKQHTA